MDFGFFKNVDFKKWYLGLFVVSFITLFFSLFIKTEGISNSVLQLTSFGFLLISIGENINHPYQTKIAPPFTYGYHGWLKLYGFIRTNKVLLDIIGGIFIFWGFIKLFFM